MNLLEKMKYMGGGALVAIILLMGVSLKYGISPLKDMNPGEAAYLHEVEKYCFNRLPFLNDQDTCQVWADKYVKLVSGFERPSDLIDEQVKREVVSELKASRHLSDAGVNKLPPSEGDTAK